jgi:hypothetical protein
MEMSEGWNVIKTFLQGPPFSGGKCGHSFFCILRQYIYIYIPHWGDIFQESGSGWGERGMDVTCYLNSQ